MIEQSIAAARASVMIYDDLNKKWIHSGSSSGLSKVQIYHHTVNNTFRVVGRKLQDHEVVINCAISKGLKYNQATVTFHQWRDSKQVYGLSFSSKEDADAFARAMFLSLDTLSNNSLNRIQNAQAQVIPNNQQMYYPNAYSVNGQSNEEDVEYSRMNQRDEVPNMERRVSQAQLIESPNAAVQNSQGHHRTSSAPPAPQPPQLTPLSSPCQTGGAPPAPPAPPMWAGNAIIPPVQPPQMQGAPPPPPPPPNMPRSTSSDGHDTNSLAAQIQSARLRRINNNGCNTLGSTKQSAENSGSSTSSGGSNYGTIGRAGMGSMASMMDEMAKTLARRRAAAEKKDLNDEDTNSNHDRKLISDNKIENKIINHAGGPGDESPKSVKKRFGSEMADDYLNKSNVNGICEELNNGGLASQDLELLKQEILKEIRREFQKMKMEIIDAIKSDGIRR
ncbi:hypothetical protein RUM44_003529 [Polyplax serrata]|uniref:WH1 domain-containing protein n=1 Tax=Polyplax serrata TaxID=468196 RepID=A0ABR1AHA6_POLSC